MWRKSKSKTCSTNVFIVVRLEFIHLELKSFLSFALVISDTRWYDINIPRRKKKKIIRNYCPLKRKCVYFFVFFFNSIPHATDGCEIGSNTSLSFSWFFKKKELKKLFCSFHEIPYHKYIYVIKLVITCW